jgi:hypothetical protein
MNDAIECRAALCGIRRHAHIEQHDNRRTFVFGDVSGAWVFDDIGEHEIYIGRSQDMPDIVVRPDFPVIRDISGRRARQEVGSCEQRFSFSMSSIPFRKLEQTFLPPQALSQKRP